MRFPWSKTKSQETVIYAVGAPGADRDVRSMPGQALERARYLYAYGPDATQYLVQFALNAWVYTAVSELAADFAAAPLEVWKTNKAEQFDGHGILKLLGPTGKPNADQDGFEFREKLISDLLLTGNAYLYWWSSAGGAPDMVYNMPPDGMFVEPGSSDVVQRYIFRYQGSDIPLSKDRVTHFRKYHPFSRYYGLGAMEALRVEIQSDNSMKNWNRDFFSDGVFAPAGILVVPPSVGDKEKERLEKDLEGKHGTRRRTAIVRAEPGSTIWHDAGLKQRDLDFNQGRLLSRQAVYEALGLPLGLYSESSTEAHARVAERLKLNNVYKMHQRVAAKINSDVMAFWSRSDSYEARFRDVRQVDWQMESLKLRAVRGIMTDNEIREKYLGLPGIDGGDELFKPQPFGAQNGDQQEEQKTDGNTESDSAS